MTRVVSRIHIDQWNTVRGFNMVYFIFKFTVPMPDPPVKYFIMNVWSEIEVCIDGLVYCRVSYQ